MNGIPFVLDPRTMYVTMAAVSLIMAIALGVGNLRGGHMRAMTLWSTASLAIFLALILYALRDLIPRGVSVIGGQSAFVIGLLLQLGAVVDFSKRRVPWTFMIVFAVICIGLNAGVYLYGGVDARPRIAVTSYEIALWLAAAAVVLFASGKGHTRASFALTATFFAVWAAANIARASYAATIDDSTMTLLGSNPIQSIWLAANFISILGTSLGFILMTKERADFEILRIASIDELTGLSNRRTFNHVAEIELERAGRDGHHLSVLMIDLDHFKRINDTHGHPMGDAVLRDFASLLHETVRPFDVSSRFGGEEFCVLLIGTARDDAVAIAERIRHVAETRRVTTTKGTTGYTVSIGVAEIPPRASSVDDTASRADEAMYRAKEAGRNRVEVYLGDAITRLSASG